MAQFYPTLDIISKFTVPPTQGEAYLIDFLSRSLDDSFEVYFNPYMNGDRPDVVIVREGYGVLIIEVKDYDLDCYKLNEKKHWILKNNPSTIIKSPLSQAYQYKENLFELHIKNLLEQNIKDRRNYSMVNCAVYFHKSNTKQLNDFLVKPFEDDEKYKSWLKYNIDLISQEDLNVDYFNTILKKRHLLDVTKSFLFTTEYYEKFRYLLYPPRHLVEQGESFHYTEKQKEIIYERDKRVQRVKGVFGSGKTTVLAARAVQAHKRTNGRVLILTYNITLKNFIHDKISKVREEFPWNAFVINNYHLFIKSELNNLGIPMEVPANFTDYNNAMTESYWETNYYSNIDLFINHKDKIIKYDVILIDEIQDYKRTWMDIIKNCFLAENGEYILFGDVKQNIYDNKIENKDIITNVVGKPTELKACFRSGYKIKDLALSYQKNIFIDKYDTDEINMQESFDFDKHGSVKYIYLSDTQKVQTLYTIIAENTIKKGTSPNDITVLGYTINLLREFDAYYRYRSGEKTNTMFETEEIIQRTYFNFLPKNKPLWYMDAINLINRYKPSLNNTHQDVLCRLFVLYDLNKKYPTTFQKLLEYYCEKYKTSLISLDAYMTKYKNEINKYRSETKINNILEQIRKNKKVHFWMNRGLLRLSTINSFKGWESEMIFLILEPKFNKENDFNISFDELLYTGLTRCRSNLVIINFGNEEYNGKMKNLVKLLND